MKKFIFVPSLKFFALVILAQLFLQGCEKDPITPPDDTKPTVITSTISGITAFNAISGGVISNKGSSDITKKGVVWSTSPNPDISSSHTNDGVGTSVYTSNLTGLLPNTIYYVRAYATNSAGTGYGSDLTFTTLKNPTNCGVPINYEGQTYETVLINEQCWFKQNLNIGTRINGDQNQTNNNIIEKHCYNDQEANCDFYGALYQWDEIMQYVTTNGAKGICPSDWHIPTNEDWTLLSEYLGGDSVAGGKMKQSGYDNWASPNTGANNSSAFTAVAGGNHTIVGFDGVMRYSNFWTSTQDNVTVGYAWSASLVYNGQDLYKGPGAKQNSFSLRCVHD